MSSRAQKAAQSVSAACRTLHPPTTPGKPSETLSGAVAHEQRAFTTVLRAVVCCEREAFGVEGAGHGPDCPLTHSDRQGGDAA